MKYLKRLPNIKRTLRNPMCSSVIREHFAPFIIPARSSTGKDNDATSKKDKDSKPPVAVEAKEELGPPPTPGFVRPENLCDEGFFTQQARQQIEEQKKKQAKPTLNNPEHRS